MIKAHCADHVVVFVGGEAVRDRVPLTGLPQKHAYHLIYRHGLDVAPDGQTLAMGSTTGALWVSRDAGDSWTALSRDLPPVYCVRFGG